jgi:hypothetical protein
MIMIDLIWTVNKIFWLCLKQNYKTQRQYVIVEVIVDLKL